MLPTDEPLEVGAPVEVDDRGLAGGLGGVDPEWYLERYPDVAEAGVDPVDHYLKFGWREGRDPRPDFSTAGYLSRHPDLVGNPFIDALRHPSAAAEDSVLATDEPLDDGNRELAVGPGGVDSEWYLERYPDVAEAGVDPVDHYLKFGWHERRDPRPDFSTAGYMSRYSDVVGNPLIHALRHPSDAQDCISPTSEAVEADGPVEVDDREFAGGPGGVDAEWYLERYPDVAEASVDPVDHYLEFGWREGRDPRPDFSTAGYLSRHPDVAGNPFIHALRQRPDSLDAPPSPWWLLHSGGLLFPRHGAEVPSTGPFGTPGAPKIVLAGHEASRSGAPLILLRLAEGLRETLDAELYVILERGGPLLDAYRNVAHVIVNETGYFHEDGASRVRDLFGSLAEPQPEVAIVNSAESWRLLPALRGGGMRRITALVHESLMRYGVDISTEIEQHADLVVFPAEAMRVDAAAVVASLMDAWVLPQGLLDPRMGSGDRGQARAAVRAELGLPADAPLILGCGTWHLRKGVDLFVQLAMRAQRTAPDLNFLWLGPRPADGNLDPFLEADIRKADLGRHFFRVGEVEETERYFLAADAFVLTSREDPFPCVVHEAMACGLPVVAFDRSGGAPEVLADGRGVVVPYLDVEAMLSSLTSLMQSRALRQQLGDRARERIRTDYRFDDYVDRLAAACGLVPVA